MSFFWCELLNAVGHEFIYRFWRVETILISSESQRSLKTKNPALRQFSPCVLTTLLHVSFFHIETVRLGFGGGSDNERQTGAIDATSAKLPVQLPERSVSGRINYLNFVGPPPFAHENALPSNCIDPTSNQRSH